MNITYCNGAQAQIDEGPLALAAVEAEEHLDRMTHDALHDASSYLRKVPAPNLLQLILL